MAPSQDPTPPTTDRRRRPNLGADIRPWLWIGGAGLALIVVGVFIGFVSPPSAAPWSWTTVASLLAALGMFVAVAIPGALVALRLPWGDGLRLALEKGYARPRLLGLAAAWAGLVLIGWAGVTRLLGSPNVVGFLQNIFPGFPLVVGLVAAVPLLAIVLFDRRR